MVKNPAVKQEMQELHIRLLGQEDPLREEMETHSSIPEWKIPWTEKLGGLQSMGLQNNWARLSK